MAYKSYGDFSIPEGAVLVKDVKDQKYYDVIYIAPVCDAEEEDKEFIFVSGILDYDEVNTYIDKSLLNYVGLETIEDYEDIYEKIYDIMSYQGLDLFYKENPFVSYETLLENLKNIEIEGEEEVDYSLKRIND